MQLLHEHRNRRLRVALQALGDGDRGRVADFRAAKLEVARVFVSEQAAVLLVAHRRWDGRLGVAARGEAEADDQRSERRSTE